MSRKTSIEILSPQSSSVHSRNNSLVVVGAPPQVATIPGPFNLPATTWGAKRQARHLTALAEATNAHSNFLRARVDLAKSFIAAARAINEVGELPEICESDTQIRRMQRERDYVNARREREEARYGLYATQDEVDKLRRPRIKKASRNGVAINALMKSKIDMEALGEDTTEIDRTLVALQHE